MILSNSDKKMLDGYYGAGIQRCMSLLVKWGNLFGADRMVNADAVHISTNFPNQAIKDMSEGANKVRAFCTTHSVFDPKYWRESFGVVLGEIAGGYTTTDEAEFDERIQLLRNLGVVGTFTCSPYSVGIIPKYGDVLSMMGSSGQVICNSFFGARAPRESISTSVAAAITGRTPEMGLAKKEERYATALVTIGKDIKIEAFDEADFGAMGYSIGNLVGSKNVAIDGINPGLTFESGRMLLSPLPVSGASVMCHIVGVTPEASTLKQCLGGRKPEATTELSRRHISEAYQKLNNAEDRRLDMVVLGCPHLTIKEIQSLASMLEGRKVKQSVRLIIGIAKPVYGIAKECGFTDVIEAAGGLLVNSCVSGLNPFIYLENKLRARVVATNSARAAHYMQRLSGGRTTTLYAGIKCCIDSAVKGKWCGE